jgi:hypothetical protein
MKKEIRIPILGVIEESETLNGNERYFLDHYPHGEGVYLVKIGAVSWSYAMCTSETKKHQMTE